MKQLAQVTEVENEGLVALLGDTVTLFCSNYFYTGELIGVNDTYVKLKNPSIIYDTGDFSNEAWDNVQSLGIEFNYIQLASIESFGVFNKK